MKKLAIATGAALALAASPALAQGKSVKIGFVSTFSGPTAVIGNDMRNSFELGLDHHRPQDGRPAGGGDLRGRPAEARGRQAEDREADPSRQGRLPHRLQLVERAARLAEAGCSNYQTFLISANAGPSQIAGELCSPYFFSTSWQNDQTPQAIGEYMNQKGVKTVYLLGPNYAAGKDMLAGVSERPTRAR